jgi:DEAD/DEAH box helicase domain-containing protein
MGPGGRDLGQLDAIKLTEALRRRLADFALDDNFTRDENLTRICRNIWSGPPELGGLVSDLWVEGAFPSNESQLTLDDLAKEGSFDRALCDHLDQNGAVPKERPLYSHQEEVLKLVRDAKGNRPAAVVTAGTGAGKTEAFLLPILNDIVTRTEDSRPGTTCIILYPMNALVNDQTDRLHAWLSGQDQITLFHFTSETPEDKRRANQAGVPEWEPCRIRTRQEARGLESHSGMSISVDQRGKVPDIIITNYSMLEYMLCRPQDSVFFGNALRTIVLDEAHLYAGTLAAEITLLLRRLLIRCNVNPQEILQIATSATLGSGDYDELQTFAAQLFSKEQSRVFVIQGQKAHVHLSEPVAPVVKTQASDLLSPTWVGRALVEMDSTGASKLVVDKELTAALRLKLPTLVGETVINEIDESEQRPAVLLLSSLAASPLVHKMARVMWNCPQLSLHELARQLWEQETHESVQATIVLLQLCASARLRASDYPLLPHRIHLMARQNGGLSVCLNGECSDDGQDLLPPLGTISADMHHRCPVCYSAALALFRCDNCGEWILAGRDRDGVMHPASEAGGMTQYFTHKSTLIGPVVRINPTDGSWSGEGAEGVTLRAAEECPNCGAEKSEFSSFFSHNNLAMSIVAETILSELPPFPSNSCNWLPAGGRRLLTFSDSRREAARLGPRLTRQHETQLLRAAITSIAEKHAVADEATMADILADIQHWTEQKQLPENTHAQRQRFEQKLRDAIRDRDNDLVGGSIQSWAEAIKTDPLLAQFMDMETGGKHRTLYQTKNGTRPWSQLEWEQNWDQMKLKTELLLAYETARRIRTATTLESVGLIEVTYPGLDQLKVPSGLIGIIPTKESRDRLTEHWTTLLEALCDTFRIDGVITLGEDTADLNYPYESNRIGRWCAEFSSMGRFLVPFIGKTARQGRRKFSEAVLRTSGLSAEDSARLSPELLQAAFRQLMQHACPIGSDIEPNHLEWLQLSTRQTHDGPPADALRLSFPSLGLRSPKTIFQCRKTGRLWPRAVFGCAPDDGSYGTLTHVSGEKLDNDARYGRQRREFRESSVFRIGLWAEEHSAQLSPQENRRIQDMFKAGIRNVLSSTTTLELGIDIGGLNAVLMGNVPPGKANYLQRAGRAGRRADGASVVITYARPRPFDQEVFQHIGDYFGRQIRKPVVLMDRDRVVKRHFHAFLLGQFFQQVHAPGKRVGAMEAFGRMGSFCGANLPPRWDKANRNKPGIHQDELPSLPHLEGIPWWSQTTGSVGLDEQFTRFITWLRPNCDDATRNSIRRLFRETSLADIYSDWQDLIDSVIESFVRSVEVWNSDYKVLLNAWNDSGSRPQCNALRYQLSSLHNLTVIEALADRQFLPHYGFPIGVHKLKVLTESEDNGAHVREEDQYRLERGSLLALREYVPGSQLLVGGKLITSHGLLKYWTGHSFDETIGIRGKYCHCINDHFYHWMTGSGELCPICDAPPRENPQDLLFPKHGFSGAAWDPPRWSTDVEQVGTAETATTTFSQAQPAGELRSEANFGGVTGLIASYREDGEILVYNRGSDAMGFAICLNCGYADGEKTVGRGRMELPNGFEDHAPLTSPKPWHRCWERSESHVLRNQTLAARETTDVLLLDFSDCLTDLSTDESVMTTIGHALRSAGARLLELDSREIGLLMAGTGPGGGSHGAVIYDDVPGGVGHVLELMLMGRNWLEESLRVLYVDEAHHNRCEVACLQCLLSYDAQVAMSQNLLNRRLAYSVLDSLLKGATVPESPETSWSRTLENGTRSDEASTEERLKRASARRSKGRSR